MSRRAAAADDDEEMNVPGRSQREREVTSYAEDNDGDEKDVSDAKKRKPAQTSSSSAKRAAGADDIDDEDNDGVGESSSSSAKRARKAPIPAPPADSDEDDNDEDGLDEGDVNGGGGRGKSHNFEAGQLLNIKVTEFMCHGSLSLDFGGHVNFITGDNGSGKSAIVAALQLCLGARADNTGRGRNLAGFIREGSDGPAVVRVTLRNTGSDAFKPDKYGDRIQIERRIAKHGSAGYKLLDNNGNVVSTAVSELRALQRQFNLYMENPCCVLTQEESKKFIQGHERDKYAFFLKATGLEQTRQELCSSRENIDEAKKEIAKGLGRCEGKVEAVKTLKRELSELMELDKFDGKISECLAKSFWCDAYHFKSVCDEFEPQVETARIARDDCKEVLERVMSDEAKGGSIDELSQAVEEVGREMNAVEDDLAEKKAAVREVHRKLQDLNRTQKGKMVEKVEMEGELSRTRQEIQTLRGRALENAGGTERELLQKIDACTRAIADEELKLSSVRQEKIDLMNELQELEDWARNYSNQAQNAESEIRRLESEMNRARSGSGNAQDRRLDGFGQKVRNVMTEIGRTRFREPVKGPLGMNVKMKDGQGRWSRAVEKVLNKNLSAFVVTNAEDQRTLNAIIRQQQASSQHKVIFQHRSARYSVPGVEGALMVNDVLAMDDDMVFNCLIDQNNIDQLVLVENEDDCKRYISAAAGFKNRHIKRAVALDGSDYTYNNFGNMKHGQNRAIFRGLLMEDTADATLGMEEDIAKLRGEGEEATMRKNEVLVKINKVKSALKGVDDAAKWSSQEARQQKMLKSKLELELGDIQAAGQIDTSSLESDEREIKLTLESLSKEMERIKADIEELNVDLKAFKEEQSVAERAHDVLVGKLHDAERAVTQFQSSLNARKAKVHKAKLSADSSEKKLAEMEIKFEEQHVRYENSKNMAETNTRDLIKDWDGQPLVLYDKETRPYLERQAEKLKKQMEDGRRKAGLEGRTIESVHERLLKAKAELAESKGVLDKMDRQLTDIEQDYKVRKTKWKTLRKQSTKHVNKYFCHYLERKGFTGNVVVNYKEQTLTLRCQTDNANAGTKMTDVRQLSGGERSYTTLCLLMALGHVIETPFRLMDEYDVFLDEISRLVTLNELLKYALLPEQMNRQFIIITPNSLNNVKTDDNVRIRRMPKPNRGGAPAGPMDDFVRGGR